VLEDGSDQSRALRGQSLAPGEDDGVGLHLLRKGKDPLAGHADPHLEADLRVIAVPTAELVGPRFDFVLGLIRERWQPLLGHHMDDDDLGASGGCCDDDGIHGRGSRHDGFERDEDPAEPDRNLAFGWHDDDRFATGGGNVGCNVARWTGPTGRRASPQHDRHHVWPSRLLDDPFERAT
jgi:hypothetical protein